MRLPLALSILTLLVCLARPGEAARRMPAAHPPAPAGCSGAGLDSELRPQPALPKAVAATRRAIARAAAHCDYDGLDLLAGRAQSNFTYRVGEGPEVSPGGYWLQLEEHGAHPMRALLRVLDMPVATLSGGQQYVWPSAYQDTPAPADWAALGTLYSAEAIEHFRQVGYLGYRIGIDQFGVWTFFMQGG